MPDYSVGNAPGGASYAAPLVGFQFGKAISDLPDDYFKGTQQARQLALQKPILDPATGQPSQDLNVITQELLNRGGAEYAKGMLEFLQMRPFYNKLLKEKGAGGEDTEPVPPPLARTNNNAGGPQYAPPQQPSKTPGFPGEGEGDTINKVVAEKMGGKPFPPAGIFSIARQLGINPSANLTPQQVAQVKELLSNSALPPGSRVGNQETNQPNVENSAQEVNGNVARASFAEGVSGGGAPIQNPLGPKVVRTQSVISPETQDALRGLIPDQYLSNPRLYIEGQRSRAAALREEGDTRGILKIPSKAREDQAATIDRNMDQVEAIIGKAQEPTNPIKEYMRGRNRGESLVDFEARRAGEKSGAEKEQSNIGEHMQKLAEAGLDAKGHTAMLNTVKELGEKVPYGIIPKIQSELGKFGIDTKGLSDIQAYERAVDYMAPQLRPIGSGRLMQQELNAFKASLGGLMTTQEGRRISVDNLKLISEYTEVVGKVASDTRIPIRDRMQKIYEIPPPHLKTLEDVKSEKRTSATGQQATPYPGAERAPDGKWYVKDPNRPGKYLEVR
jgi:hypothetical protein